MLSEEEKKMILNYFREKTNLDDFIKNYPKDLKNIKNYPHEIIANAIAEKKATDIDYAFSLAGILNIDLELSVKEIVALLLTTGHSHHEDMANWLRDEASPDPEAIDALYQASFLSLDYLKEDEFFELARKSLHALRAIGTLEAIEKIKAVARETKNQTIRGYALRQLEKLGVKI